MMETAYQDLIEKRKSCKECQNYGLCDDLTQSDSNGLLYQLETASQHRFSIDSLGLWNPVKNSNPLSASILIIGKDFSNVGYFDKIDTLLQVEEIESKNITNKNLIRYIESSGIDKNQIYFTNAVLCIKGGKMNAPVKKQWINNCSKYFLNPLITQHLINLKIIITIGVDALDAVKKISDFSKKDKFSSLPGKNYDINIDGKPLKLYPMFHTGNLGAVNAAKADKKPGELWSMMGMGY